MIRASHIVHISPARIASMDRRSGWFLLAVLTTGGLVSCSFDLSRTPVDHGSIADRSPDRGRSDSQPDTPAPTDGRVDTKPASDAPVDKRATDGKPAPDSKPSPDLKPAPDSKPSQDLTPPPCKPGATATLLTSKMAVCDVTTAFDQCGAEAAACGVGWKLCLASTFAAAYPPATTLPTAAQYAWIAGCARGSALDGICTTSCPSAAASSQVVATYCFKSDSISMYQAFVGIHTGPDCMQIQGVSAAWEPDLIDGMLTRALCCR
jgi:hypothetical protein